MKTLSAELGIDVRITNTWSQSELQAEEIQFS